MGRKRNRRNKQKVGTIPKEQQKKTYFPETEAEPKEEASNSTTLNVRTNRPVLVHQDSIRVMKVHMEEKKQLKESPQKEKTRKRKREAEQKQKAKEEKVPEEGAKKRKTVRWLDHVDKTKTVPVLDIFEVYSPEEYDRTPLFLYNCDGCGMRMVDCRFHCDICPETDFCGECYLKLNLVHKIFYGSNHSFTRMMCDEDGNEVGEKMVETDSYSDSSEDEDDDILEEVENMDQSEIDVIIKSMLADHLQVVIAKQERTAKAEKKLMESEDSAKAEMKVANTQNPANATHSKKRKKTDAGDDAADLDQRGTKARKVVNDSGVAHAQKNTNGKKNKSKKDNSSNNNNSNKNQPNNSKNNNMQSNKNNNPTNNATNNSNTNNNGGSNNNNTTSAPKKKKRPNARQRKKLQQQKAMLEAQKA